MNKPHVPQRPRFMPEITWGSVTGFLTLATVLAGGLVTMLSLNSTWAVAQTDIDRLKQNQQEMQVAILQQQDKTDAKIQQVQASTERRLDVIHTDVQAIKNILISQRRGE